MTPNPILEEIYAAREELLAEHQGDVHAYVREARRRALASGRLIAGPKHGERQASKDSPQGAANAAARTSEEAVYGADASAAR
jgi:hypothetical protein